MDSGQREGYISSFFELEFADLGQTWLLGEVDWFGYLLTEDIDRDETTKPYGLLVPQMIDDRWVLGICPTTFVSYIENDEEMNVWLEYWLAYVRDYLHQIAEAEHDLTFGELQERVVVALEDQIPEICFTAYEMKNRVDTR